MTGERKEPCAECGGLDGRIQHVDIAWPTTRDDLMKGAVRVKAEDRAAFLASKASGGGKHFAGWLHPECEHDCIRRLETEWKLL